MATYKALPYGISDFGRIRRENYYLVDKSSFITKLEETASFLFLIRPRRFGKSLFLSMLRYYYDIAEKDNFQGLFKGLWIADHPTWNQGRFQVMHIDEVYELRPQVCGVLSEGLLGRIEQIFFRQRHHELCARCRQRPRMPALSDC